MRSLLLLNSLLKFDLKNICLFQFFWHCSAIEALSFGFEHKLLFKVLPLYYRGRFHQHVYKQLLCAQIPKAQKKSSHWQVSFCTFGICKIKLFVKCWCRFFSAKPKQLKCIKWNFFHEEDKWVLDFFLQTERISLVLTFSSYKQVQKTSNWRIFGEIKQTEWLNNKSK